MFSGREQGPDLMNRTPSFSSILLFSFDAEAVRIFFAPLPCFSDKYLHLSAIFPATALAEKRRILYNIG